MYTHVTFITSSVLRFQPLPSRMTEVLASNDLIFKISSSVLQVSSNLLHVWFLVCCVFNSAVDCVRDYNPAVLFPSLCRGMEVMFA